MNESDIFYIGAIIVIIFFVIIISLVVFDSFKYSNIVEPKNEIPVIVEKISDYNEYEFKKEARKAQYNKDLAFNEGITKFITFEGKGRIEYNNSLSNELVILLYKIGDKTTAYYINCEFEIKDCEIAKKILEINKKVNCKIDSFEPYAKNLDCDFLNPTKINIQDFCSIENFVFENEINYCNGEKFICNDFNCWVIK